MKRLTTRSRKTLRFGLVLAFAWLWMPASSLAQSACAQLGVDCSHHGSAGGSGGGGGGRRAETPAEAQARREYAEYKQRKWASDANNKGIRAFNKGNYAEALKQFRTANANWASSTYADNIHLAEQRLGIQRQQEAATTAAGVDSRASTHIAESEKKSDTVLSRSQQKTQAILAVTSKPAQQGTNFFGSIGDNEKPTLATVTLPSAQTGSALEQASSMAQSGAVAKPMARDLDADPDIIKAISNCGSDTNPCAQPEHIEYARPVQSPDALQLADRIPEAARKDPDVQKRMSEFDHFVTLRLETEKKIAAVEQKIKANDPNAEVLKVYHAQLANEAAHDKEQEQQAKTAIKNKMDDLGLDWVEQAPKPSAKQ
jgi:hypothetical protein